MDRVADFALQTIGQMGKRDLSTAASRFSILVVGRYRLPRSPRRFVAIPP